MVKTRSLAAGALLGWALWVAQPAMGQDAVDGVCDDSTHNGCTAGTPTTPRSRTLPPATSGAATACTADGTRTSATSAWQTW